MFYFQRNSYKLEAFDNSVYGATMSESIPNSIIKPKETITEEALANIVKEFTKLV